MNAVLMRVFSIITEILPAKYSILIGLQYNVIMKTK